MKIAIYGVWHVHATGYTKKAMELGEVIGVYEENKERRDLFCENLNLPVFETEEDLLKSDADGVIVCCSTDTHADAMIKIANSGKDIFTEKVLALSLEDCERVEAAVTKNKVRFVISLPQKYSAAHQTVKKLVDSGELGKINYLRFRNCHSGSVKDWLPPHFYDAKECGGGAMIDLGAHGMYLTHWLLGMPDGFSSVFTRACHTCEKNKDNVEDNAVTVMQYKNGCIAINETGFVSQCYPSSLEVGGDLGYLHTDGNTVIKTTVGTENVPSEEPLLDALPNPLEQFLTGNILEGCGMEEAIALTCMMEEAYNNINPCNRV